MPRVEIGAVRIEAREHPVDRALDQRAIVDLVDIIGAHAVEHAHELLEFLEVGDVRPDGGGEGGGQGTGAEQSNGTQHGLLVHLVSLKVREALILHGFCDAGNMVRHG